MASEWFYQIMGDTVGPLSVQDIKAHAHEGRITHDTKVRKGIDGQWILADRVKGLLPIANQATDGHDSENGAQKTHATFRYPSQSEIISRVKNVLSAFSNDKRDNIAYIAPGIPPKQLSNSIRSCNIANADHVL